MADDRLTIYHNPGCSKSRETLQILKQRGIHFQVIEYLDQPPTKSELVKIIKMLGVVPSDLVRTTEAAFKKAEYKLNSMSDEEVIDAICENPTLLQRPIVIYGNKAVIGRPPIKVLDIIPVESE
ncbi:MAG: arsenate reductase [Gammaproteobacteria bacterium]|jgi:arsenate reductase